MTKQTAPREATPNDPESVEPLSTVEAVVALVRAMIHRGELGSGDRLPSERQFAEQLGVGRMTLRYALRQLRDEGYIVARRGAKGGSFVSELQQPYEAWLESMRANLPDFEDLLEFRAALERRTVQLACERRTDADLAAMREALDALVHADTLRSYRRADLAFHHAIGEASRSPRLTKASFLARAELMPPTDALIFEPQIAETASQHGDIFEAIEARDSERAAKAIEAHVEGTRLQIRWLLAVDERPDDLHQPGGLLSRAPRPATAPGA